MSNTANKIKMVKLGDVFKVASGGTPSRRKAEYYENGDIPWVKTGDLKTRFVNGASEYITQAGLEGSSAKMFPAGSVLMAMYGATIGACSILGIDAATNQACGAFLPTEKVLPDYLYYYLSSIKSSLIRRGVGGAQPNISGAILKDTPFPLISLPEQKRIAEILDLADDARRKRRENLKFYDDLIRSLFLQTFGDLVNNQHGFEAGTIRDLVTEAKYGTSKKADVEKGEYPVLRMGNITYEGNWDFSDLKYVDLEEKELGKYLVHKGDLLFNRTNSKELVGKTAVFREEKPMAAAGYLIRVRANELANTEYISAHLNSRWAKAYLRGKCKSIVGMANINAQELQDIPILKPPVELQNEFSKQVKEINAQKAREQALYDQHDDLFNALLQRAFNGEVFEKRRRVDRESVDKGKSVLNVLALLHSAPQNTIERYDLELGLILMRFDGLRESILSKGRIVHSSGEKSGRPRITNMDDFLTEYNGTQFSLSEEDDDQLIKLGPKAAALGEIRKLPAGLEALQRAGEALSALELIKQTCREEEDVWQVLGANNVTAYSIQG